MLLHDIDKTYDTVTSIERTVLKDAERQAENMIAAAQKEEKKALRAAKAQAKREVIAFEQKSRADISAAAGRKYAEYAEECRKKLILKRTEIKNEVFCKLKDRLCAYVQTPEYEAQIGRRLAQVKEKVANGQLSVAVSRVPADARAAGAVFPGLALTETDSIAIGGCIVTDHSAGIVYDLTLDSDYQAMQEQFPEISGLSIEG